LLSDVQGVYAALLDLMLELDALRANVLTPEVRERESREAGSRRVSLPMRVAQVAELFSGLCLEQSVPSKEAAEYLKRIRLVSDAVSLKAVSHRPAVSDDAAVHAGGRSVSGVEPGMEEALGPGADVDGLTEDDVQAWYSVHVEEDLVTDRCTGCGVAWGSYGEEYRCNCDE